jgi:hypothetical protein
MAVERKVSKSIKPKYNLIMSENNLKIKYTTKKTGYNKQFTTINR